MPRTLDSILADHKQTFEIIYRDGEIDRVMRPTGHPLAVVEACDAAEALCVYQAERKLTVAGYGNGDPGEINQPDKGENHRRDRRHRA